MLITCLPELADRKGKAVNYKKNGWPEWGKYKPVFAGADLLSGEGIF